MSNASAKADGVKRGGICASEFRGLNPVLTCEHIGKVTIKQIYEKGFRVVLMKNHNDTSIYVTMVIEEQ
jgi:hypothetical protein